jgi:very-short-patch-repair endonuclease
MSYYNQRDHEFLDRLEIKDYLMQLATATVQASSGTESRAEHYARLVNLSESGMERSLLKFLYDGDYRLPSAAQRLFEQCATRPDLVYEGQRTVIYVDGPHHEYPDRAKRDADQSSCMEDLGWTVLRIDHDDWGSVVSRYPNIFGAGK